MGTADTVYVALPSTLSDVPLAALFLDNPVVG